MPDWIIRARDEKAEPRWNVRVADCDREHAESVLETLELAGGCPSDLYLTECAIDEEPPSSPSLLKRLIRRG